MQSPRDDKLHSSKRATASGRSSSSNKFTYWSHWSNMNKLGGFMPDTGSSEPCRSDLHHHHHHHHYHLTSENLEFHNKVHESLPPGAHVNGYIISTAYERCSPYYRGLTDSTLALNRGRSSSGHPHSPGRDSIITSTTTISTTLSTLAVKMHELTSSCTKFACGMFVSSSSSSSSSDDQHQRPATTTTVPKKKEKSVIFAKDVDADDHDDDDQRMMNNGHEKPLREREVKKQKPLRERMNSDVGNKKGDDERMLMMIHSRRYKWADMYRPKKLEDFICNKSKAMWLKEKVKELGDCGHLIFQGPAGVGKTTMILALLREAFGDDKIQVISEFKEINLEGEALGRIKVRLKKSAQHYEIKVSDLKGYEKHVIVELMKETQMLNATDPSSNCECRAIVLLEADRLGTDTLMYIKWLLEKYKGKNKVLFSCSDVSKLHPLMPVCNLVQLLQASREETVEVLEFIAGREGIEVSRKMAEKITDKSNNNLRQAIRSFEATWHARHVMDEEEEPLTGWEDDIANIAKNIIDERTPRQLYIFRGKLQNLIEHQVSPEFIFQFLVRELKKHLPDSMHAQLDCLYAEYTRDDKNIFNRERLLNGCRNGAAAEENGKALHDHAVPNSVLMIKNNIIHHFLRIEEFTAKFMSWYNYQSRMSINAADELPT